MDNRMRVLVVEDIATARESYMANLELTELYRVDPADDLSSAYNATDRCTYHVAVVDLMLAGSRDVSNRDGVKVVQRIQRLAEGTKTIVLSGQKSETELVGNLLMDYGVYKYLDKRVLEREGIAGLLVAVESAAKTSTAGKPTWESVRESLAPGREEKSFVSDIMGRLKFNGGFENLSRTLVHNMRHLVPLLPSKDDSLNFGFDDRSGFFKGVYWSKGQGQAVEIFLGGKNAGAPEPDDSLGSSQQLLEREKAGFRFMVYVRTDLTRDGFASRLLTGAPIE